jgi:hypothetical protein
MKGRHGKHLKRLSLGPSEDVELWFADTLSGWLLHTCNVVQCHPPEGFNYTSHNLRKGDVSASHAIGARLTDIRCAGGWSTNSNVLEARYVDFAMLPTPAARLFFGYQCKGAPHEGCLATSPTLRVFKPAHFSGSLSPRGCSSSKWSLRGSK